MNSSERTIIDYTGLYYIVQLPIGTPLAWKHNCILREYIKSCTSKYTWAERLKYNGDSKLWTTELPNYKVIVDLLAYLRDNHLPFFATDKLITKITELENYDARGKLNTIELKAENIKGIKLPLRNYQYTAVKFLEDAGGKAIIALGTGVGKTLVALSYCIKNNKKAIIICPSQGGKTKRSWAYEVYKCTDKQPLIIWSGSKLDLVQYCNADFIIVNYELLDKFRGLLLNLINLHGFDTVIIDESHSIKNLKAKRTSSIHELSMNCTGRILLSATAIRNKPDEIYSQLNLVAPERFNNKRNFKEKYYGKRMFQGNKFFYTRQSKIQLTNLNLDIQGCYFYRDKMKIVFELPSLMIETIYYDLPTKIRSTLEVQNKQQQFQTLAHAMIPNTVKLVEKLLLDEDNKKIILYSGFVAVVEELTKRLGKLATLNHGRLTSTEQQDNFKSFVEDSKTRVIVATYQSLSESINLQEQSSIVVFNDTPYLTAQIEQAYGRVYRIGQKDTCYCYLQGFSDTYTDEVFTIIENKDIILKKVLEGKDKEGSFCNQVIKPKDC